MLNIETTKDGQIKERIIKIILDSGKNKSEFAREMGITPNYLAAVLSNSTKGVSATLLKGLAQAGVNVNYLLTGKGDMLTGNGLHFEDRAKIAEARVEELESMLQRAEVIAEELKKIMISELKKQK